MRTVQRKDKMRSSPEVSARFLTLVLTLATLAPVVNAGWIDIETPLDRRTTTSLVDGTVYHLVRTVDYSLDIHLIHTVFFFIFATHQHATRALFLFIF
jgi:hypothetical protein